MVAPITFRPLDKNKPGDEWFVWQALEDFLDEHGFNMPRGVWTDDVPAGYAAPVVEWAVVSVDVFLYRCDGSTILRVEWDGDDGKYHVRYVGIQPGACATSSLPHERRAR